MTELTKYSWWTGDNPPPEHLKTKKQLAELKLRGVRAVAKIETTKYSIQLFEEYYQLQQTPIVSDDPID